MTLTRLRRIDFGQVPAGVWVLLALAALVVITLSQSNFGFDLSRLPATLIVSGPLLFAAAVVYAVPKDRRLVIGSVLLVVGVTLRLFEGLLPPLARVEWTGSEAYTWVHSIIWLPALIGFILLGLGVGGVRTRLGWLIVAVVSTIAVAAFVGNLISLMNMEPLGASGLLAPFVVSTFGFSTIVATSYFFAAAIDQRLRLTALGVGITLALWLSTFVMQALQLGPGTDFTFVNAASTLAQWLSWVALIAGALIEFPGASRENSSPA